jgi:hypothetical protein
VTLRHTNQHLLVRVGMTLPTPETRLPARGGLPVSA